MPSWAWVVTSNKLSKSNYDFVSMPSWDWVVTIFTVRKRFTNLSFNALTGLNCYAMTPIVKYAPFMFQCPHGLELLHNRYVANTKRRCFNALSGLSCYNIRYERKRRQEACFNALSGLSCYLRKHFYKPWKRCFNALMGLSCYSKHWIRLQFLSKFQCPHGLELLLLFFGYWIAGASFNALMGLSCYCKNVQYFKFFMILFMHPCYL